MNVYLFFREGGFYPLELTNDEAAKANAEANPGTIRVENAVTKALVWWKPAEPTTHHEQKP